MDLDMHGAGPGCGAGGATPGPGTGDLNNCQLKFKSSTGKRSHIIHQTKIPTQYVVVSNFDTIIRYKLCTTIHEIVVSEQRAHISNSTERRNIYRCNCCIIYSFHFSDTL